LAELDSLATAAQKRIEKSISKAVSAYLNYLNNIFTTTYLPPKDLLESPFILNVDATFVEETQTLIATALLMGMEHASRKINAADVEIPALPFEEAVSFMRGRIPMTKTEWTELVEPKLRFRAFTVARLAQCDFIEATRGRLINAMEKGEGFASTWQDIKAIADADGAFQFRPGYWENVFRTNTQTAYTTGKLMQHQKNPPPAWQLLIVEDSRTSSICRGLIRDGKQSLALPSNHPFWEKYGYPPYHFQCRTGLQAVYASQIGTDVQVENPTMKSLNKHFKPMEGFGGNPLDKESWWMMTEQMVRRAAKYNIIDDVTNLAHKLGMENYLMSKLKGFETLYTSKSGGYVKKAGLAKPGTQNIEVNGHYTQTDELGAAKRAAASGNKIFFMPRVKKSGTSDLDIIINNNLGEIKHIFTPSKNAITETFVKARSQGASVVLLDIVTPDLSINFVKPIVQSQLGEKIKKAIVLFGKTEYVITKK